MIGKRFLQLTEKLTTVRYKYNLAIIVLCASLFLTGCRGDWSYELPNDYDIVRINGHCIQLSKKDFFDGGDFVWSTVIENYYVKAFCVTENYILTAGVETKEQFAEDEEIEFGELRYYMVDYNTDEIKGPFSGEDELLNNLSMALGKTPEVNWIYSKDVRGDHTLS